MTTKFISDMGPKSALIAPRPLPHNLIQKKLINLIETTFQREGTLYLACYDKIAFFTPMDQNGLNFGLAKMFVTL